MAPTGWLGLTSLGIVHTAISLIAVFAGIVALLRYKEITLRTGWGQVFVWTTVLTCLTGFGIFQHGGFGKPHALALITLATLAIARAAIQTTWFGRRSAYVEMVAYSATLLFHFIPALTETGTRLPVGAPFFANAEDPLLKMLTGALVLVFLVGATLQVVWLGRQRAEDPGAATPA